MIWKQDHVFYYFLQINHLEKKTHLYIIHIRLQAFFYKNKILYMKQFHWYGIIMSLILLSLVLYGQYSLIQTRNQQDLYQVRNQFDLIILRNKSISTEIQKRNEEVDVPLISESIRNIDIHNISDSPEYFIFNHPFWILSLSSEFQSQKSKILVEDYQWNLENLTDDIQELISNYNIANVVSNWWGNYDVCLTWAFAYEQQNTGLLIHPNAPVHGPFPIDACIPVVLNQGKVSINQEKFQEFIKKQESQ